jgi:uroporphyrinogen decarboxylase
VDPVYFDTLDLLGIEGEIEPYRKGSTANYYDERLLEKLDIDFRHVWFQSPDKPKSKLHPDGTVTDEWGITWSREGSYPVEFPLKDADIKDLETYPWPMPDAGWNVDQLRERSKYLYENTDYAVVAKAVYGGGGIFERCYYLRSIDNFFVDMTVNKEFAKYLLDKVVEVEMAYWKIYLNAVGPYVHIIQRASDLGTQLSPFISPQMYREFLKPVERRIMEYLKSLAPQAKLWFHSCGAVSSLIDDFIDIGVQILNPVQPLAAGMDSFDLKKRYGRRLSFHGGIDLQEALPGSKDDVRKEVETRIQAFGPGGGYILAPANHIQHDTPAENVVLLYTYAREYGRYPLKGTA